MTLEFDIPTEGNVLEAWPEGSLVEVAPNVKWCLEHEDHGIADYNSVMIVSVTKIT